MSVRWRAEVEATPRGRVVRFPDNVALNRAVEADREARRRLPDGWRAIPHPRDMPKGRPQLDSEVGMSPLMCGAYAIVLAAAEAALPMPSNDEMTETLTRQGFVVGRTTVQKVLVRLEQVKALEIERGNNWRRVLIVRTGQRLMSRQARA